jgi:4-hydroxy-tetrahydrodipicolinate reductase
MEPVRVVQMGIGEIGRRVTPILLERPGLRLVGAIDSNPELRGRSLGEVIGAEGARDILISDDVERVMAQGDPDVVVHTTLSRLPDVVEQIEQIAMLGANVVSSTEELLYSRLNRPDEAERLEAVAIDQNVAILGTGVNPGFVMDTLAIAASAVCRRVDRVECRRIVDAATRRRPLQAKVGAGMTREQFQALVDRGKMGHVGLVESVALIAVAFGWAWEGIEQTTEPVIAEVGIQTEFFEVMPGQVAGIKNTGFALIDGERRIQLELQMYLGARDPMDEIVIHGEPDLTVRIPGGTPGDIATAAILVNAIPAIVDGPPGLLTMLDVPILRCR